MVRKSQGLVKSKPWTWLLLILFALTLLPISAIAAPDVSNAPPARTESLEIEYKGPTTLEIGQTVELKAMYTNPGGKKSQTKKVTWKSSKANVASIDGNGKLKALAAGETTVTASMKGAKIKDLTASITFQVKEGSGSVISKLELRSDGPTALKKGSATLVKAVALTADGKELPAKGATFRSSDDKILSVDATGKVTALSEGSAAIWAELALASSAPLKSNEISFTVTTETTEPQIVRLEATANKSKEPLTLKVGDQISVEAFAFDSTDKPVPLTAVKWMSSEATALNFASDSSPSTTATVGPVPGTGDYRGEIWVSLPQPTGQPPLISNKIPFTITNGVKSGLEITSNGSTAPINAKPGDPINFSAALYDASGQPGTLSQIIWKTSDNKVVDFTTDATNQPTASALAAANGTAAIWAEIPATATTPAISSNKITVVVGSEGGAIAKLEITALGITGPVAALEPGQPVALQAAAYDASGKPVELKNVLWTSSNWRTVSLDPATRLLPQTTGIAGMQGDSDIWVEIPGKPVLTSNKISILVGKKGAPFGLKVTPTGSTAAGTSTDPITLKVGERISIEGKAVDAFGQPVNLTTVHWFLNGGAISFDPATYDLPSTTVIAERVGRAVVMAGVSPQADTPPVPANPLYFNIIQ